MIVLVLLVLQFTSIAWSQNISLPDCNDTCGNVSIPYPFGMTLGCYLPGFNIDCSFINGAYKPLINDVEILNISLLSAQARVNNRISSKCNRQTPTEWGIDLVSESSYRFSDTMNKFTVMGCSAVAYIFMDTKNISVGGGCVSFCDSLEGIVNGTCSGIGCCQTSIPKKMNYYHVVFGDINIISTIFNPCSYAVLMDGTDFYFDAEIITSKNLVDKQVPLVLDWAIRTDYNCEAAMRNSKSYACVSEQSYCVNSSNDFGYWCNCSAGYQGNPYLMDGCKDINECDQYENPCPESRKCKNKEGDYTCLCPIGKKATNDKTGTCELDVVPIIGICVGLLVWFIFGICIYVVLERGKLKKMQDKNFAEYGGLALYQKMGHHFTIFTQEQIEKATMKYDSTKIVGQGGHGTVYQGILKDQPVAIKKCKHVDQNEDHKKEFGKEILILSQINHKNIVKLLGCCLQVEVPMLVFEYISNGTLYEALHRKNHRINLSFENRLRIAQESAEALAYLHSSASPPILHGDVKSSNILLDEKNTAKVSDFGASILAPTNESQFGNVLQGTRGYLDPEYLVTCQLTNKSDVYSFGVVILELLTRKLPLDFSKPGDGRALSSCFLSAMKENKLLDLLDDQIKMDAEMDLVMEVAELAKECLNIKGEERPTMKEVAETLDKIRKSRHNNWGEDYPEESESLLGSLIKSHQAEGGGTSRQYSHEVELIESANFPR